jgi:hypothetical protein
MKRRQSLQHKDFMVKVFTSKDLVCQRALLRSAGS